MKYDFTGKERDNETNYDYFGARYYDSRIGRWGGVEPLLQDYFSWSPYQYGICNPTNLIDFNGKDAGRPQPMPYDGTGWGYVGIGIGIGIGIGGSEGVVNAIQAISETIAKGNLIDIIVDWITNPNYSENTNDEQKQSPQKTKDKADEIPEFPVPEIDWENFEPKNKDEWEKPANPDANWTKPKPSKEYLRPDPKHKDPIGPHTDWRDQSGKLWRIFPDGRVVPKN
jgi:RHS repeat-associated protein